MLLRIFPIAVFLLFSATTGKSQSAISDPQGVAVLTQALTASGAANPLNPVRSFTAEGTITYFWGGERVQALSTIRAKGHDHFRLDSNVPRGLRSISFSRDAGARKDEEGKLTEIPLHNRLSMGGSTFPYLSIAAALLDRTMTVSYIGLVESSGRQVHQVRTMKTLSSEQDPRGIVAKLSQTDFFVDTQTNLVVKTADFTHPLETLTEEYLREVEFEGYTATQSVAVPTVVREKVNGNTVWEFRVSAISFNTDLSDSDFSIQ